MLISESIGTATHVAYSTMQCENSHRKKLEIYYVLYFIKPAVMCPSHSCRDRVIG